MRVVALINGSLIAHTASLYALSYAKGLGAQFDIIHIRSNDPIDEVEQSAKELQEAASDFPHEYLVFESFKEFQNYVLSKEIDVIFCSTRHDHSLFDKSFVKMLIHANLSVDIAVVKVVKLMYEKIEKLILPIRSTKLSVEKFSFFTTLVLAYEAKASIYAIDKTSRSKISLFGVQEHKKRLQEIIFDLRHYLRLAQLFGFKLSIKHDFSDQEGDQVKAHIADNGYDLAIVGGHHSYSFFDKHPLDILFVRPMLNTIYFIPAEERS